MKNAMWLADFDFQTSGWIFSVSLYPNESTESVTSRFPPKMGNSSTPGEMKVSIVERNSVTLMMMMVMMHFIFAHEDRLRTQGRGGYLIIKEVLTHLSHRYTYMTSEE